MIRNSKRMSCITNRTTGNRDCSITRNNINMTGCDTQTAYTAGTRSGSTITIPTTTIVNTGRTEAT